MSEATRTSRSPTIPGARWREDKSLLETVVNLTEFPSVILGNFDREFLDLTYSRHVDEDIQSGKNSRVKSTPTFFINGDLYNGAWDLDSLLSALDEEGVFSWRQTNSSI